MKTIKLLTLASVFLFIFNGCKKEKLESAIPQNGSLNVQVSYIKKNTLEQETSFKQKYDQLGCVINGTPGIVCMSGGGGTCTTPSSCTPILLQFPTATPTQRMEIWNKLPKATNL